MVITFDDGFKSCITCAVPILQKLALPATFFISSGFIGLSKDDETSFIHDNLGLKNLPHQKPSGGLTREDVKKMADLGFTIGGHTVNHAIISSIQDKDILQFEINEDKMAIEGLIGRKIDYFAYPAGAYNNAAINITEVLREAGYKAAVTTMAGFNNHTTNPFLLRRELTRASMPAQVFKASVYGNRDAVNILKKTMTFYRRLFDAT